MASVQGSLAQPSNIDPSLFATGIDLYQEHCAICHGAEGDGAGPLATGFSPRPRNFTLGVFKFQSTSFGEYPAQSDIIKTIRSGIEGSYGETMPAFDFLSEQDLIALTEVIRYAANIEEFGTPLPAMPRPRRADLERGAELYLELRCVECHGEKGDGQGFLTKDLTDTNDLPIRPADFRTGQFKGGNAPEDIWFRVYAGLSGTPMPGFGINTSPEDIWAVTEYIMRFSK